MRLGRINTWMVVALVSAVPVLQSCETVSPVPPSYNDVVKTAFGIRTGQRLVQANANWQFHTHEDLDDNLCADLAVSPEGVLRYLAFLQEAPFGSGNWLLSIRTGLGTGIWSSTFSEIVVPEIGQGSACVRIKHLKDRLYVIVWVVGGELHSALFDSNKSPGEDLVLNEAVSGFDGINVGRMSLVYFNNEVRLVWSPVGRNRIMTKRGTLTESGINFPQGSEFTPIAQHGSVSDVIADGGALFVATTDGESIRLYSTSTGGTQWAEQASCPTTWKIEGKLLYTDADGRRRVAESINAFDNRLRNFTDCTTTAFPLPIVSGVLTYFPGQ